VRAAITNTLARIAGRLGRQVQGLNIRFPGRRFTSAPDVRLGS
jgi:hypothetical protein